MSANGDVHRLFLGLPVEPVVARTIGGWAASELPGVRIVPPENLHVTLLFFGSVDAAMRDRLVRLTRETVWEPMDARTGELAAFGKSALALRLEVRREQNRHLDQRLSTDADPLGRMASLLPDRRVHSFRPHLTVARAKSRPTFALSDKRLPPLDLRLGRLALYESHLGPEGSRYEVLDEGRPS